MFRFDIIKPEIQEIVQEKEVSKKSLRQVFFYSLLEIERLREHLGNLEFNIEVEKDLYKLLKLGDRKMNTCKSIEKRKRKVKDILPLLMKAIINIYTRNKNIDGWDYLVVLKGEEINEFLEARITYTELINSFFLDIS